jgi:hypothetical protein
MLDCERVVVHVRGVKRKRNIEVSGSFSDKCLELESAKN